MSRLPDFSSSSLSFYTTVMKGGPNPFRNALSGHLERARFQNNITVFTDKENEITGIVVPLLRYEDVADALNILPDEELGSIGNFADAIRKGRSELVDRDQNLPVFVKRGNGVFGYGFFVPPKNFADLEKKGIIPKIEKPQDTKLDYDDIESILSETANTPDNADGVSWLEFYGFEINPFHPDMDVPNSRIRSELFLQQPNKAFQALEYLDGDDIAIIRERVRDGEMEVIGMLSRTGAEIEIENEPDEPTQIFPERGGPTSDAFGEAISEKTEEKPEPQEEDIQAEQNASEQTFIICAEADELYKLGVKKKREDDILPVLEEQGQGIILMATGSIGILVSESTFENTLAGYFEKEVLEDYAITTFSKSGIELREADNTGAASLARIGNPNGENIVYIPVSKLSTVLQNGIVQMPNHAEMRQAWIERGSDSYDSTPIAAQ